MVFIPKGSQIFDQLPSQFESFFPSEQSLADGKMASVLARAGGSGQGLLTRVQAETITQGLQLVQQAKAVLVGDFLSAKLPQLVSFTQDSWGQKIPQGLFASVPFPNAMTEDPILGAMADVGLKTALSAISAVPIVGRIAGLIVNVGMALARLFAAREVDVELPPLLLPWTRYGRDKDEDLVNKGLILSTAGGVDWTSVWLPGLGGTWTFARASDEQGKEIPGARVYAPLVGKEVGWSRGSGLGAIPNTLRVAGPVQTLPDNRLRDLGYSGDADAKSDWEHQKRFILRGDTRKDAEGQGVYNELYRPPTITDTGSFYPAFAGIAGQLWQQVQQRGNPDMYKIDALKIRDSWQDYWGSFFEDAFNTLKKLEQLKGKDDQIQWLWAALTPYVCVIQQNGKSVTLGMADIDRPQAGPLVTPGMFAGKGPGPLELRTPSLYSEVRGPKGWDQAERQGDMAIKNWDGKIIEPARMDNFPKGYEWRTVPWPSGVELLSYYKRPDEAIITPACEALSRAQKRCLESTLICAYVRPVSSGGKPAYAAFADPSLRQKCLDMREILLKHDARYGVSLPDVDAIDPAFAAKLRASGVGKPGLGLKISARAPLLVQSGGVDEAYPTPVGGLAFDTLKPKRVGRSAKPWVKIAASVGAAAVVGGAIVYSRRSR